MIASKKRNEILFEAFCESKENEKDMFVVEGLVVDEKRKRVGLTDEHNQGVDFSNKTYLEYKYKFDGDVIDVISIFKRTPLAGKYKDIDGNPFIYALKNKEKREDDWMFEITNQEIYRYIHRFLEVCNSIDKQYDTIIMVPSHHDINERFMRVIFNKVGAKDKVEDFFYKTTKADAYDSRDLGAIRDYCLKRCNQNKTKALELEEHILDRIDASFDNMPGDYFKASRMDKEYIKFIKRVVTPNNKYTLDDASRLIRGKHVLILDDTLSTGATISSCVKNIKRFGPAKLQVITLLSNKRK